jgi:hypothetical protein
LTCNARLTDLAPAPSVSSANWTKVANGLSGESVFSERRVIQTKRLVVFWMPTISRPFLCGWLGAKSDLI